MSGIRGTHELDVEAWHRDGLIFRLGFWKLEEWRGSQEAGLEFPVIFEARVLMTAPMSSGNYPVLLSNG